MSLLKNRTVVGVLCIVLSLAICFGITPLFNKSVSQKTKIVRITKDMVQMTKMGGFGLLEIVKIYICLILLKTSFLR